MSQLPMPQKEEDTEEATEGEMEVAAWMKDVEREMEVAAWVLSTYVLGVGR